MSMSTTCLGLASRASAGGLLGVPGGVIAPPRKAKGFVQNPDVRLLLLFLLEVERLGSKPDAARESVINLVCEWSGCCVSYAFLDWEVCGDCGGDVGMAGLGVEGLLTRRGDGGEEVGGVVVGETLLRSAWSEMCETEQTKFQDRRISR